MLHIVNLIKRFKTEGAQPFGGVLGINLDIKAGHIFTLLGPSGCGKTTTLRCVAGLEQPDSGQISLDGNDVFNSVTGRTVPMYDRNIGMVFQSYAIWPHMSVFENAAYPLRVKRVARFSNAEVTNRVNSVLDMVGLGGYGNRSATKLSGGQQQRLALARALVRGPKLLLLDEPLSSLDAQLREQMRAELKRIQLERGVTTIYVTHDQAEAMAMSDVVAVLNQGRVMQVGTPEEIYEAPQSDFVANFIGRTNLFRGVLEKTVEAGDFGLVRSDIGLVLCRFTTKSIGGRAVSFVIRPEWVQFQDANEVNTGDKGNLLDGRISGRVYLGDIAEYTVEVNQQLKVLVRARPGLSFQSDERVRVHLPPERTIAIAKINDSSY